MTGDVAQASRHVMPRTYALLTDGSTVEVRPARPVSPGASSLEGLRCLPSVAGLPEHVDLAVIAVPPAALAEVAEQCGQRRVPATAPLMRKSARNGAEPDQLRDDRRRRCRG
jgi:predicted CoA-binding protein